jgi:branched-chain amino acid transport system substrate-binding protein
MTAPESWSPRLCEGSDRDPLSAEAEKKHVHRGWRGVATLALLTAAFAVAASCERSPAGPSVQEIPVGGLFALSGIWAANGQVARAAMELGIEDVNDYLAGNAANVRFVARFEDTGLDPDLALQKAQLLRTHGVRLLIGPMTSAQVAAVKPFVDANSMLLISATSTAPSLAIADDNVFRFAPGDSIQAVAVATMMWEDGRRLIAPVWRDDAAGDGLQGLVRARFVELGGVVLPGVKYGPEVTDFTSTVSELRGSLQPAIAEHGTARVAVHLSALGEVAELFAKANADPVLGSVPWYGSDGVANNQGLLDSPAGVEFAIRTGYPNPVFGLDEGAREIWEPLIHRIRALNSSMEPDAYAVAVYDAVWVVARAYIASGATQEIARLGQAVTTAAAVHYGGTGWTVLDHAGDRRHGDFDFWAIRSHEGVPRWTRVARFESRTGRLFR